MVEHSQLNKADTYNKNHGDFYPNHILFYVFDFYSPCIFLPVAINLLEGTHTLAKKLGKDQEPNSKNSYKAILLVKPWNSIGNTWRRTPTLSGGAPLFIMCLCLQSKRDVSFSVILFNIPCR